MYRKLSEPPNKVRPVFSYAMLGIILLLLAWNISWRANLPPDYAGDQYGNVVVALMLLFNHLAFQFHWPILATVLLRTLAVIWFVFACVYIVGNAR